MRFNSIQSISLASLLMVASLSGAALAKPSASSSTIAVTPTGSTMSDRGNLVETLKLSTQQKNQIRGIRAARTKQIAQVLTQAQRTKLQQEMKSGMKLGQALKGLNLNATQSKKIAAIVQRSAQQIKGVLTTQQRQQLETYIKQQASGQAAVE